MKEHFYEMPTDIGNAIAGLSALAIKESVRENLHKRIMTNLDAEKNRIPSEYGASRMARFFSSLVFARVAVGAVAIFLLAFLIFLWHNSIEENSMLTNDSQLTISDLGASPPPEGAAADVRDASKPTQSGIVFGGAGLQPADTGYNPAPQDNVATADLAVKPEAQLTVRQMTDATVLVEWTGPEDATFRIYKSPKPDFSTYCEWVDVQGTRWHDRDTRSSMRFYKVERIRNG